MKTLLICAFGSLTAGAAVAQATDPVLLPGDLSDVVPAESQARPFIAPGDGGYLVVWEDTRVDTAGVVSGGGVSAGAIDILAMRLDADGVPLDSTPILVSRAPFEQSEPEAAWNDTGSWLVVWRTRVHTSVSTTTDIAGARIGADGTLLDPTPISIEASDDVGELRPSVASNGEHWMVTWWDFDDSSAMFQRRAALLDATGATVLERNLYSTANGTASLDRAHVAYAAGRYLLVAERAVSIGTGQVVGRLFDAANLTAVGGEIPISTEGQNPAVASDGNGFHVVWSRRVSIYDRIYGTNVSASGAVSAPDGLQLSPTFQSVDVEPQVAWDGLNWLVAVDDAGSQNPRVDLYTLQPNGFPVLLTTVVDRASASGNCVVAGGAVDGSAVAIWQDWRREPTSPDLFAARVEAGADIQLGPLEASSPNQTHPALAGDSVAGYLVVFLSKASGAYRLLGQRLDGGGLPNDLEPFEIAAGAATLFHPRVAWNGSDWLVVWEQRTNPLEPRTGSIHARLVTSSGVPSGPPRTVQPGNWPDVASRAGRFLVASSDEPIQHQRIVLAREVDSDGLPSGPSQTVAPNYARFPRVAALGTRWLVVWQHNPTHDNPADRIHGTLLDDAGGLTAVLPAPPAGAAPDVTVLDDIASIVFRIGDSIRYRLLAVDGSEVGTPSTLLTTGAHDRLGQTVGHDGEQFLAVWTDYRAQHPLEAGLGDLYGTRWAADGTYDFESLPLAEDPLAPEGAGAVAGDAGVTIVAYPAFVDDGIRLGWRTHVRVIESGDGLGSVYCHSTPNSTGTAGQLIATGSRLVADNDFTLTASGLPPGVSGLFFFGPNQIQSPLGHGILCVGGAVRRIQPIAAANGAGIAQRQVDLSVAPAAGIIAPGASLCFQQWYRDGMAGPPGSNLTDAIQVTFQ